MPAWIHDRAEHLLAKNPKMTKSQAFAISTQQAHKLGRTPKGYGTPAGRREAKAKYDKPKKSYVRGPNPGNLETPKLPREKSAAFSPTTSAAFIDQLFKIAKYLTDQIDEPKTKPRIAAPPNKKFQVKQGMNPYSVENTGMDPRQRLLKSQKVGKPADYKQPKLKPLNIKVGAEKAHGDEYNKAVRDRVLKFLEGRKKMAATPTSMLSASQRVGKPKTTAPPGPSIAQISKPVGFGRPLPGAKKGNATI